MRKIYNKQFIILFLYLILFSINIFAQTTSVTATITDSDSQIWTNAKFNVTFVPNPSFPNLNLYTLNGSALTSPTYIGYLNQIGVTNGSGLLTVTLLDNNRIQPSGSTWKFVLQSNTSAPATTYTSVAVTGASENLTSFLSNNSTAPRFPAIPGAFGYADGEVSITPQPGGNYFNTTTNIQRIWTGTAWTNGSGSGAGTVTNFTFPTTLGSLFNCSVSNPTTTPIVTCTVANAAANSVFGNFTGSSAAPTFSVSPIFSGAGLTNLPFMSLTTIGSSGAAALNSGVLNIPTPIGAVASVFSRTGVITAQNGDYTVSQITGAAPLASPTFTGTPLASTASLGTNTTQLATTAFVNNATTSLAPLASPTFTGTPTAPTQSCASNTDIATGAYVAACAPGGGTGYTSMLNIKTQGGAACNGSTVDGTTIQNYINSNAGATFYFPAGCTALLNNSGTGTQGLILTSTDNNSTFFFAKGASLVCNTSTSSAGTCVWINGASNLTFYGLNITYSSTGSLPLARNAASPNNSLLVQGSTDIAFYDTYLHYSPGVGAWNTGSTRIKYIGYHADNTSADGLHFESCESCGADTVYINNSGDDMVAWTEVTGNTQQHGYLSNATLIGGHARGVVVVGTNFVTVTNATIDGTAYSCFAMGSQSGYTTPSHITISNSICNNPGGATPAAGTAGNIFVADIFGATFITINGIDATGGTNTTNGINIYANNSVNSNAVMVTNTRINNIGSSSTAFLAASTSGNTIWSTDQVLGTYGTAYNQNSCTGCQNYNHTP